MNCNTTHYRANSSSVPGDPTLKNYFDSGKARANGEPRSFEEFLAAPEVEQIHFIGKDIIYFHTLFWPAMLKFAGRKVPDNVYVHGFIMLSGAKMSKSRGTGLSPLRYLELGMSAEWLRYYIAAKLNANVEDIDFNPDDFVARVNSDLVGKYVNIASRCAAFISRRFDGKLGRPHAAAEPLLQRLQSTEHTWEPIGRHYDERETGRALREVGRLLDEINQYIDEHKPWELAKVATEAQTLHEVCSSALAMFWYVSVLLKPVLPVTAERVRDFLNLTEAQMGWGQHEFFAAGHEIKPYSHLMTRVDPKQLDALLDLDEAPAKATAGTKPSPASPPPAAAPVAGEITVEDFAKLDLRVAKILAAEAVDGADKLLKLTLDIGAAQRTVFSGIRSAYAPEQLVGRHTVVLANLKPKKMRFGTSEGMVLSAGPGGKDIFLLSPDSGATAGMKVT